MDGWRDPLQALKAYETWLARQPLSPRTRGEYARWVRLFCGWLHDGADERALGADPLADLAARDYAARDFKRFLKSERALGPASVNLALAAVDHLYRQLGLGRANVRRESLPVAAPRALSRDEQRVLLRAAERAGARDRALVVLMLFARAADRRDRRAGRRRRDDLRAQGHRDDPLRARAMRTARSR